MSKAKGTGRGTGKKGWNRWQAAERRAANSPKPYKSKGTKNKSASNEGNTTSSKS
ncbi:DUF3934 family protein [Paenibacillus sp. FSL W7-1287]|uniref:DUF3934 family protein n=1 Tax=Paenibacillus sp. FSL W7-1287 TaxID=2954538 RepID=UPI0030FCEF64